MNKYEVMYIIDAMLEEAPRKALIERFSGIITAAGGSIDMLDEWGKRRLAYPINFKNDGYYILMYITAPTDLPKELERNFSNSDAVLRYLVVTSDGKLPPPRRTFMPAGQTVPIAEAKADAAEAVEVTEPVVETVEVTEPVVETVEVAEPVVEVSADAAE